MNRKMLRQLFAPLLILLFVFSCVGTSLGMTLHSTMLFDSVHGHGAHMEETQNAHQCCTVEQSEQQGPLAMAHMSGDDAALLSFFSSLLIVVFYFLVKRKDGEHFKATYYRQYLRRWQREWQYLSLYILRLFSKGILHPKAW